MNTAGISAFIHLHAPHSGAALFLASIILAVVALGAVFFRCLYTGSVAQLPENWVVTVAATAAPVPTFFLLLTVPLDADLGETVFHDPVVVMLAGLYGLAAAFRDLRGMASRAHKAKNTPSGVG